MLWNKFSQCPKWFLSPKNTSVLSISSFLFNPPTEGDQGKSNILHPNAVHSHPVQRPLCHLRKGNKPLLSFSWEGSLHPAPLFSISSLKSEGQPYHYLDFSLAHLEIMLIVDKHAFQGTFHSIACPHQKHDSKSTCEGNKHTSPSESCSKSRADDYVGCSHCWWCWCHCQLALGLAWLRTRS